MAKIGRNDLCPCGSGKKYKKCCLNGENSDGDMLPVIAWVFDNSQLKKTFDAFAAGRESIDTPYLIDAFIFDYKLQDGRSPFQWFLDTPLSEAARSAYERYLENIYSLFQVKEIKLDEALLLDDIMNGGEYWINEKKGTHGISVGQVVIFRIAQTSAGFAAISPGGFIFPSMVAYSMKRALNHGRIKEDSRKFSAIDVLDIISRERPADEGVDALFESLKEKTRKIGIAIDLNDINKRINSNTDFRDAFPELFNFAYESEGDFKDIIGVLMQLWNNYPRDEFKGKAPNEVHQAGPEEQFLLSTLFNEVQAAIDPDKFASKTLLDKAVNEFQTKWFSNPQKELEGRSPEDVILKERAKLGNPRKELELRISIDKIALPQKVPIKTDKIRLVCNSCNKRQQLDVGAVIYVLDKKDSKFFFELETKCKACGSYDLESNELYLRVLGNTARSLAGKSKDEDDISIVPPEFIVAGIKMHYSKLLPYFEERCMKEPNNGELHLRFANTLRKFNKYTEAIKEYEKALLLNKKLLAAYVNLVNIYIHRHIQYKEKEAKNNAEKYLTKAKELFQDKSADFATLPNRTIVEGWLKGYQQHLQ